MESKNKFRTLKKTIFIVIVLLLSVGVKAQSIVSEVSWNFYGTSHKGLIVIYPNNMGFIKIKAYSSELGYTVWVLEDAMLTNQYDIYGNCTTYITCSNPRTVPYVPWAADNFVIFPDGSMYTQDAAGAWSTYIAAYIVPPYEWQSKFREYGIQ
ncbi:MAG: hypothetical protein U0L65_04320 [Bacteroidales bacterium]|jgi:hypothetical protein|nr:hypothetical protein [Bacteroidales bacterium]MEE0882623.1 hypothetical protein [Bacteroidales bacterium]